MPAEGPQFVEWREQFISQERGSRVVHYYLDDSSGESHLAVVGTEKSVRHMLYVVSQDFCESHGSDKLRASSLKWRSRREVVDWLTSFLPRRVCSYDYYSKSPKNDSADILGAEIAANGANDPGSSLRKHPDHLIRSLKGCSSEIVWSGAFWTCGKQLKHYQAFCRNGTTISIHSFVLVMSEEENRYLAYLEDMYEDKKGHKKVRVRWFHQNQEFLCPIPPPKPHPREVFITPYFQVISAECVDDLATLLTPDHYEKCFATLANASSVGIHLCFRQYSKNRFKPFDLTSLSGYFDQALLSSSDIYPLPGGEKLGNTNVVKHARLERIRLSKGGRRFLSDNLGTKIPGHENHITACGNAYHDLRFGFPAKRPLSVKFIGPRHWLMLPYRVDQEIELLCQDSGIRGCWFRCTVLQVAQKRLKVRYHDVPNEDGCGNLEEWIPAFKTAAPDKLGMRCLGRFTIRPCQTGTYLPDDVALQIGTAVDAWWNDGWWEGVIVGVDSCVDNSLQVYFSGEDVFLTCNRKHLRISKDWVENRWVGIEDKKDITSLVSSRTKVSACSTCAISSTMSDHNGDEAAPAAIENNGLAECINKVNPHKRRRDENDDDVHDSHK